MKKIKLSFTLFSGLVILFSSHCVRAEMEIESAYFQGLTMLNPGYHSAEESKGVARGVITTEWISNGNVIIKSFDRDDYSKQLITIPSFIHYKSWGATAIARSVGWGTDDGIILNLGNIVGKKLGSIFGTYKGGTVDLSVLFNLGYKAIFNSNAVSLSGFNTAGPGFGVDVSYVEVKLSPNHFTPGKVVKITPSIQINTSGPINQNIKKSLDEVKEMVLQ